MSQCTRLRWGKAGFLVIRPPRALEAEAETPQQDICLRTDIGHANRRWLFPIEDLGLLAFLGIEVEICLHAAGQHVEFGPAGGPKRAQKSASSLRRRLYEHAAVARTGGCDRTLESIARKLDAPRHLGPFDPYPLRGYVQQIGTGERAGTFRICKRRA